MEALPTKTYEALAAAVRSEVLLHVRTLHGTQTWCQALEDLVAALPVNVVRRLSRKNGVFRSRCPAEPLMDLAGAIAIDMYVRNCKSPEAFRKTLLHEWAHALVHWVHGPHAEHAEHGPIWAATAKALGLEDPKACTTHDDNDYYVSFRCACADQGNNRMSYAKARKIKAALRRGARFRCGRCSTPIELAA